MPEKVLNVGFIGAGGRAMAGHYPAVARLHEQGVVRLRAICELNEDRLKKAGDRYGVADRYTDHHKMLAEAGLDAVYVIMQPQFVVPIVLDCVAAGKHVLVEKPPANSIGELETMLAAAERHNRVTAVCFQRRYAPVAQEVRRLILERGPVTMCIGEFHKNMLNAKGPSLGVSTLLDDIIHAADFVRYMCGGDAVETHAFQDRFFADWKNCYNGLVRFSSGAVGIISGNRSSGARVLRFEVHGRGIGAEIDMPNSARIWGVEGAEPGKPLVITGAQLVGSDEELEYEGTLHVHRDFVESIAAGRQPLTSFRDCLGTMRLIEAMEGD